MAPAPTPEKVNLGVLALVGHRSLKPTRKQQLVTPRIPRRVLKSTGLQGARPPGPSQDRQGKCIAVPGWGLPQLQCNSGPGRLQGAQSQAMFSNDWPQREDKTRLVLGSTAPSGALNPEQLELPGEDGGNRAGPKRPISSPS